MNIAINSSETSGFSSYSKNLSASSPSKTSPSSIGFAICESSFYDSTICVLVLFILK